MVDADVMSELMLLLVRTKADSNTHFLSLSLSEALSFSHCSPSLFVYLSPSLSLSHSFTPSF
jgi:hypothetical protein